VLLYCVAATTCNLRFRDSLFTTGAPNRGRRLGNQAERGVVMRKALFVLTAVVALPLAGCADSEGLGASTAPSAVSKPSTPRSAGAVSSGLTASALGTGVNAMDRITFPSGGIICAPPGLTFLRFRPLHLWRRTTTTYRHSPLPTSSFTALSCYNLTFIMTNYARAVTLGIHPLPRLLRVHNRIDREGLSWGVGWHPDFEGSGRLDAR
jgi:hypothetical protein